MSVTMKTVAFVPIRLNSKRVPGKNLKLLGGKPLLRHILETLTQVPELSEIYAYCSREDIMPLLPSGVSFLKREERLDDDLTKGAEIYDAFVHQVPADFYLLAHTTSPFIRPETVSEAIQKVQSGRYDSALAVERVQTFTWYKGIPLNYALNDVPRTQDIEPVFVETSAFFLFSRNTWLKQRQRIGDRPYFAEVDRIEGIDIDNPADFELAERLVRK